MSQDFHFLNFVNINFTHDLMVTHSSNRLTAIANSELVIVWDQEPTMVGPNLESGSLICIIANRFANISQICWVDRSDLLAIVDGEALTIWDIYLNAEVQSLQISSAVIALVQTNSHISCVLENGEIFRITGNKHSIDQTQPNLTVVDDDFIIVYPYKFHVDEGEWVKVELEPSRDDKRVERRFEIDNNLNYDGELYYLGSEDPDSLLLEEKTQHLLDSATLIVIKELTNGYIFYSDVEHLLLVNSPNPMSLSVGSGPTHITSIAGPSQYYVVRNAQKEKRYSVKNNRLVEASLTQDLVDKDLALDLIPLTMYLDRSQQLDYARVDFKKGFVWYPDHENDHAFIDLHKREGSIFTDTNRDPNAYVQVEEFGRYIMDWRRGKSFPSGKLIWRDSHNPEDESVIMYDIKKSVSRVTEQNFVSPTENGGSLPLVIPEWSLLDINVIYRGEVQTNQLTISTSQYYFLIDELSKFKGVNQITFPVIEEEIEGAFLLFGDLTLEDHPSLIIEKISPIWKIDNSHRYLCYYTESGICHILDLKDPYYLPVASFVSNLPVRIEFDPNDQFVTLISFLVQSTSINTHPQSKYEPMDTMFPYIEIVVFNLSSLKVKRKTVRFPVNLVAKKINIVFEPDRVNVTFPSYTDPSQGMICSFNKTAQSFSLTNQSDHFRFWKTHTPSSPYSMIGKGDEFPLDPHPEIKREYTMRPGLMLNLAMVRKLDNLLVSAASGYQNVIPQISDDVLYSLAGTMTVELPFYYTNQMRFINIEKQYADILQGKTFTALRRIDNLPYIHVEKLDLTSKDKIYLKRMEFLIDRIIEENEIHSEYGIAFRSSKVDIYKSRLSILKESIYTAIDFIEGL